VFAKARNDYRTDALARIAATLPEEVLSAELARRADTETRRRLETEPPAPIQPAEPHSLTIDQWCARRKLSRSKAYQLWRTGRGPQRHYIGDAVRISDESDRAWLAEMEAANA
jgi:hypothetical protein